MRRPPEWLLPMAALAGIALAGAALVYALTGGRELADDAPSLLRLVRDPFALWQSYRETGLHARWGSFPPLLPPLFGLGVAPWLALAPDFWAIRLGALTWSIVALFALHRVLTGNERISAADRHAVLWVFALLPSVWGAVGFIPQEEIYVGLFALALYALARDGRWAWVPWALAATALAGKYFVLILVVPLALATANPLRNLILFGSAGAGTLVLYVTYHWLAHGLVPIASHMLGPEGSISVWALLWNLGVRPSLAVIRNASVLLACGAVLSFCFLARRRRIPLAYTMAASLYLTLLSISITFPAYVLWVVPLTLVCAARMAVPRQRWIAVALMFGWSCAEWGSNFFRGLGLALRAERAPGKELFAARVESILGPGFPYDGLNTLCIAVVLVSGLALVAVLWRAGVREGESES